MDIRYIVRNELIREAFEDDYDNMTSEVPNQVGFIQGNTDDYDLSALFPGQKVEHIGDTEGWNSNNKKEYPIYTVESMPGKLVFFAEDDEINSLVATLADTASWNGASTIFKEIDNNETTSCSDYTIDVNYDAIASWANDNAIDDVEEDGIDKDESPEEWERAFDNYYDARSEFWYDYIDGIGEAVQCGFVYGGRFVEGVIETMQKNNADLWILYDMFGEWDTTPSGRKMLIIDKKLLG